MSKQQESESSKPECSGKSHLQLEDKEHCLNEDDNTGKQEASRLLDQTKSFLHLQDVLQEDAVNADDRNSCQSVSLEEEDETSSSDSDTEDNVNVIIGNININPSMLMEMFTNLNSQAGEGFETSESWTQEVMFTHALDNRPAELDPGCGP
ncbi:testis-specific protein TSX-like [Castor canadensis]|uniref:Testis-specific protein TSX-like n=1 Tax=Castor canadensis TaxID=51338 RepID=A0AC58LMI7_CASCN